MSDNDFRIRPEEPPARTRVVGDSSKIDKEIRYLRKHAGTWFKVREAASAGAYTTYKKRGCETRTKTVAEGKYDIWARFPKDDDTDD